VLAVWNSLRMGSPALRADGVAGATDPGFHSGLFSTAPYGSADCCVDSVLKRRSFDSLRSLRMTTFVEVRSLLVYRLIESRGILT